MSKRDMEERRREKRRKRERSGEKRGEEGRSGEKRREKRMVPVELGEAPQVGGIHQQEGHGGEEIQEGHAGAIQQTHEGGVDDVGCVVANGQVRSHILAVQRRLDGELRHAASAAVAARHHVVDEHRERHDGVDEQGDHDVHAWVGVPTRSEVGEPEMGKIGDQWVWQGADCIQEGERESAYEYVYVYVCVCVRTRRPPPG
jgi:hypothetical protein